MKRIDWFQDPESITLTLYDSSVLPDSVRVALDGKNLTIFYNTSNDEEQKRIHLNLFSYVKNPHGNPQNIKVALTQKKMELKLFKTEALMWDELESKASEPACPGKLENSYTKFSDKYLNDELEEDVDLGSEDRFMKLLQDIYSKGDDKTKRAMVKSFTTSAGKVLSTNWDNVKDD